MIFDDETTSEDGGMEEDGMTEGTEEPTTEETTEEGGEEMA
ncbi:MAG: hypothetical protein WCV86_02455 [Patescibacteria group bacterium]|jgi:hypothetical protein